MKTDRTELAAADLFVLLDREFRRRRPRECVGCFVQLPYRIDTFAGDGSNWEVTSLPECELGCNVLLEEIVEELRARYALRASS